MTDQEKEEKAQKFLLNKCGENFEKLLTKKQYLNLKTKKFKKAFVSVTIVNSKNDINLCVWLNIDGKKKVIKTNKTKPKTK